MNAACVVSGHAWMRFEDDKEMIVKCIRYGCPAIAKIIKSDEQNG